MAKKEKVPAFPSEVYITRESDADEPYFITHEKTDSIEDGATVGVYQLVSTKRMRVVRELE